MKKITFLLLTFLILSCQDKSTEKATEPVELSEAEKIAEAYGINNWDKVEEINFTFNVASGENDPFRRHWKWNPNTNDVTMMTLTDTVSFNRASIDSTNIRADQSFINDKYWLLTPFQLKWDEGVTMSETKNVLSPIDSMPMNKLTLVYDSEGGYTPGDAYDLYYDNNYKIKEWVFRKSNDSSPSLISSWENEETLNGITIVKDYNIPSTQRKIYFTDVSIKMKDK